MTGLSLFIEDFLQAFSTQFDFKRRCPPGLLDEGVKDQNTACGGGVVKRSKTAVRPFHAEFGNTRGHSGHRPRVGHAKLLPQLQTKEPSPNANARFLRKSAYRLPRLRMEDYRPHKLTVSNVRHRSRDCRWLDLQYAIDPHKSASRKFRSDSAHSSLVVSGSTQREAINARQ